jgi:hypothetical protein
MLAASALLAGALADVVPYGQLAIFASVAVLRLSSLAFLRRLHEPGARGVGEVLALARRTIFGV